MHCSNCGAVLRIDDAFCPTCGQVRDRVGILEHGHLNPAHAPKRMRTLLVLFIVLILPILIAGLGEQLGLWVLR